MLRSALWQVRLRLALPLGRRPGQGQGPAVLQALWGWLADALPQGRGHEKPQPALALEGLVGGPGPLAGGTAEEAQVGGQAGEDPWSSHVWLAAPKSKVSRARKRRRLVRYRLKPRRDLALCERCGQARLLHRYCDNIQLCAMRDEDYEAMLMAQRRKAALEEGDE